MLTSIKVLSVLLGLIIGAGIFGLPYVFSQSGIIPGFFYLFVFGIIILLIHLFFGEIVLRTNEQCRLPGFTKKYLGKKAEIFIAISTILSLLGTLLAFIILGGDFLEIALSFLDINSFYFSLAFWLFLSFFIFRGIKLIGWAAIFTNILFFLIIFSLIIFALPRVDLENFVLLNTQNIFLPYGVILFSLIGLAAIPEASALLKTPGERKKFPKIIITSSLVVVLFYLIFALTISGVSGQHTTPDVFEGLIPFLPSAIIALGALAATITIADSFLVLGLYFKNILVYDYRLPKFLAAVITITLPLFLFLFGLRDFITVISIVGVIIGTIEGITVILIFQKAKKQGDRQPEYSLTIPLFLLYGLILVLALGAIIQFIFYI
jgi:amino acid permease